MSSKSQTSDQTSSATSTTVIDRKAIQERGQQILDSLIIANDDKVVKAAVGEAREMLVNLGNQNAVTTEKLLAVANSIFELTSKDAAGISRFGLDALEKARSELRQLSDTGRAVIEISSDTVDAAMTMAQKIAQDQAKAQAQALQIVAEAKTGADGLQNMSALIMGFALLALWIVRGQK